MRKYYLFVVKKEFSRVYRNNAETLYKTLENLYKTKSKNFNYEIALYNQLCLPFNVDILTNYFDHQSSMKKNKNKYFYRNKSEVVYFKINYSCCQIVTNMNLPSVLKVFDYYSKDIFVCDFENRDYFWLTNQYNKKRIYEYN